MNSLKGLLGNERHSFFKKLFHKIDLKYPYEPDLDEDLTISLNDAIHECPLGYTNAPIISND